MDSNNKDNNNKSPTKYPETDKEEKSEKEKYSDRLFYLTFIMSLYESVNSKNEFNFVRDIIDKSEFISESSYIKLLKKFSPELKVVSPLEIYIKIKQEFENKIYTNKNETCQICLEDLYENIHCDKDFDSVMKYDLALDFKYQCVILEKCVDHCFHIDCLLRMLNDKDFLKCPICRATYGILKGNQPDGTMTAFRNQVKCSGYENYDTIVIEYNIPTTSERAGTRRRAFLPTTDEGFEVLGLLKVCFDRKLIFTIGRSVTTGIDNSVIWNGVHHKTNYTGGIYI